MAVFIAATPTNRDAVVLFTMTQRMHEEHPFEGPIEGIMPLRPSIRKE